MSEINNYFAVQTRFPNCYLCRKYSSAFNCHIKCLNESAFEPLESVTVTNATEPTITHTGMEIDKEFKLIDRAIENIVGFFGELRDTMTASERYTLDLLESRRDALISQKELR